MEAGDYLYEDLWIVTEPISWAFHVLVVVELCRLVLTHLAEFTPC